MKDYCKELKKYMNEEEIKELIKERKRELERELPTFREIEYYRRQLRTEGRKKTIAEEESKNIHFNVDILEEWKPIEIKRTKKE